MTGQPTKKDGAWTAVLKWIGVVAISVAGYLYARFDAHVDLDGHPVMVERVGALSGDVEQLGEKIDDVKEAQGVVQRQQTAIQLKVGEVASDARHTKEAVERIEQKLNGH
jgi:hypothetical protein